MPLDLFSAHVCLFYPQMRQKFLSSVTVPVSAMNQFRWQNVFFFVDAELLCSFELLSSDSSEIEKAIQLQGVLKRKILKW